MATGVRFIGAQHPEFGSEAKAVQPVQPDGAPSESQSEPQRYPAEHIEGVPARDLSNEEWSALPEDVRKAAVDSGLYEVTSAASRTANRASESEDHEGAN